MKNAVSAVAGGDRGLVTDRRAPRVVRRTCPKSSWLNQLLPAPDRLGDQDARRHRAQDRQQLDALTPRADHRSPSGACGDALPHTPRPPSQRYSARRAGAGRSRSSQGCGRVMHVVDPAADRARTARPRSRCPDLPGLSAPERAPSAARWLSRMAATMPRMIASALAAQRERDRGARPRCRGSGWPAASTRSGHVGVPSEQQLRCPRRTAPIEVTRPQNTGPAGRVHADDLGAVAAEIVVRRWPVRSASATT